MGLHCVAEGQGDAGAIAVTWKRPTEKKQADVANQARIFACTSALVLGADVIDGFLNELVRLKWLKFSEQCVRIATKATTGTGGVEYSFADRANAICKDLGLNEELRIAGLELLSSWRNAVAHSGRRRLKISAGAKELLLDHKKAIHTDYSHLDIELALRNFESRKPPVPKEVTSLLAMTTNLCRAIDQAAIIRVASTEPRMDALVEELLKEYFLPSDQRNKKPWGELSEAWQGPQYRRKDNLLKILQRVGVSAIEQQKRESGDTRASKRQLPVSSKVSEEYLEQLIAEDRFGVARRLCIETK